MCGCCWKEEFAVRNFLLRHHNHSLFGTSQCGRLQGLYILYRVLCTLFLLGSWIYSLVNENKYYPIYLTNWSFMMVVLSCALETISAIWHQVKVAKSPEGIDDYEFMPVFYKITWVFHNVSNSAALLTSLLYWLAIYPGSGQALSYVNMVTHGANSIYVLLNLMITAIPIRLLHVWHPLIYCVLYCVFSLVYHAAHGVNTFGKPYIYSVLDWGGRPGMAAGLVVGVNLVAIPLVHFLCFLVYKLRMVVYHQCDCRGSCYGTETDYDAHKMAEEGQGNPAFKGIEME